MASDKLYQAAVDRATPQQILAEDLAKATIEVLDNLLESVEEREITHFDKVERALYALGEFFRVLRVEEVEYGMLPRLRDIIVEYQLLWWGHWQRNDFWDDDDLRTLEGSVYAMMLQYQQFFDWGIKDSLIISHHRDRLGWPGEPSPGPESFVRKKIPKRSLRHRGFAVLRRLRRKVIPKAWRYAMGIP